MVTCLCGDTACPSCGPAQGGHAKGYPEEMREWVADWLSIDNVNDVKKLASSRLYKATSCGAYIKINMYSIQLGSIVEGCDADVPEHTLHWPFTTEDAEDAIAQIECDADVMWRECNEEECDE